eukprot:TRINITY_DN6587_c0_g1_i1.p1 TRINITY_DN6587_c0_g1~~TRINITY_DN6587_c0_g1_i1.p1  ORF type:complete len:540 (-),score=161.81 TRINITY_DN6587_c0_g1_i1:1079-2698(-)
MDLNEKKNIDKPMYQLKLEELLNEDPILSRSNLGKIEIELEEIKTHLLKFMKAVKQYQKSVFTFVESGKDFLSGIESLMPHTNDFLDSETISMFKESTKGFERMRDWNPLFHFTRSMETLTASFEVLGRSMDTILKDPLNDFVNNELNEVSLLRKKLLKAKEDYDTILLKNNKDERKKEKVQLAQETFDELKVDYISRLLSLRLNKKFYLVKILNNWVKNVLIHYDGGNKLMSRFETFLELIKQKYEEKDKIFMDEKEFKKTVSGYLKKHSGLSRSSMQGTLFDCSRNRSGKGSFWIVCKGKIYKYSSFSDFTFKHANDLLLFSIKKAPVVDSKFCFELISPNKHYTLGCLTENERDQWMFVIQNAIGDQLNSSSPEEKKTEFKKSYALETVLSFEGNEHCADCEAPFPDWASVNLGITVCIECSGVHRSLGVNFSKVRSLTLDTNIWDQNLIKLMSFIGNSLSNSVWEYNVQPPYRKISKNSSREERNQFIIAKYKDKKFSPKLEKIDFGLFYLLSERPSSKISLHLLQSFFQSSLRH